MIDATLSDIARNLNVAVSATTVAPGDLVLANVVLPLPGDSPALGVSAFTIDVRWRVTKEPPTEVDGFAVEPRNGGVYRSQQQHAGSPWDKRQRKWREFRPGLVGRIV